MPATEPAPRDTLYFDGQCGMCRKSSRRLRRLDWLGALYFEDSTALPDDQLPVTREEAMTAMPMRTKDGRILLGFPALRRALLRTPLGFLPALALYLPGVSHLGRRVYRHVAANRERTTTCDAGCAPRA